jgi:alkyl hydroperoxide reductase subunit AhpC
MYIINKPHKGFAESSKVLQRGELRGFNSSLDWPDDKWKLVIFFPAAFSYVCPTEMGALKEWAHRFSQLNCQVLACSTDKPEDLKEWFATYDTLVGADESPIVSSTELPVYLDVLDITSMKARRSSVFVSPIQPNGSEIIIKQDHFPEVGRSFSELYRQLAGHLTGQYCGVDYDPENPTVVGQANGKLILGGPDSEE